MGVVSAGAAVVQTWCCGSCNEMILIVVLAGLAAAAAASNDTHTTTETPTTTNKEILKASETGDPTKVEIVKQIRRLNEDGSYTIGYEADDGTFKIESRDVLGNVKGTFGYIDKDGEIKRVTYSSSSDSTPAAVPVTTTTPSPPAMIVRMNKTVSSTTRRPLPTVVYPTRGSYTTRGTVIQPIPRRRSGGRTTNIYDSTTERQKPEETTTNILNLYKPKMEESLKTRTQVLKPMPASVKDDLFAKQTTTKLPGTMKPVYEHDSEKTAASEVNKANTIRRELTGTSSNPRMVSLQQSTGDDSTDVYGSHLSLGTVRPLFTTTTPRPRLVPIHSLVAARQKIHQQYQEAPDEEQETTIEASTGRVFDQEVTSNPVPVVHIPAPRDDNDRLYHQQPIYRRPATAQFRTQEYLRDNPGAPVPIGNQRPFLHYEYQNKVLNSQYMKENSPPPHLKPVEAATSAPYDHQVVRPVTRIIPVPVDERGVPLPGYQARFANPYRQPQAVLFQPRYDPTEEMYQISAPVSTRDLRRLLQILILRQNRLQTLMDQMMPGPVQPYQPLYRDDYRYQMRQYQDEYDYRYEPREVYSNAAPSYEDQYESQRYVPRRRYTRPYDTAGSSSNRIEESPEYLPPEIREALLLKMLILAINPDYLPTPAPPTELTTAAPRRKQVRNVQILGVETPEEAKQTAQLS